MPADVTRAITKAVSIPSARIHAYVERLRRLNPNASDDRIVSYLESGYRKIVTASSAAVGAAAAAPGAGTLVAVGLTGADIVAFLGESALFTLAVADVRGVPIEDVERRRALVLTALLGKDGVAAVTDAAAVGGMSVGRALMTSLPASTVRTVRMRLARRYARRQLAKSSGVIAGRLVPLGIGAAIGAVAGRAMARTVIEGVRAAFA